MSITSVGPAASRTTTASQASLAANFDNFLKLLTTQLQRQDPLAPMDASTFTSQLVEFASVEQAIQTNTRLNEMRDLMQAAGTTASLSLLGKEVVAASDRIVLPAEGGATIRYRLAAPAASVTVTVADDRGRVVHRATGPAAGGLNSMAWDGRMLEGSRASPGSYKITVSAKAHDGSSIKAEPLLAGRVLGVEPGGSEPRLIVDGANVPLTAVETVRDAG